MIWENQHWFKHNAHFHTVLLIGSDSLEVMWLHQQKQWENCMWTVTLREERNAVQDVLQEGGAKTVEEGAGKE